MLVYLVARREEAERQAGFVHPSPADEARRGPLTGGRRRSSGAEEDGSCDRFSLTDSVLEVWAVMFPGDQSSLSPNILLSTSAQKSAQHEFKFCHHV